ncbi:hypothetical protein N0V93_001819 [Gnomoniopsis smithogilvyi]|uniref:Zinc metallopeptidase n=1 Tax=Gnomoniopsis smithogilvyi TaxID=1191159 RepID=A0A9W8Z6M9_9PEZI|nr:hypothetical protein N0V93_001819 [Gnomoniopsis smithogilvyi]
MVQQREHDALVASYRHLPELPRSEDALLTLRKIASLVKPIMRARGWTVSELCEFYPSQQNLLGDRNQFLPIEQVTDTMLHELCHIVHGPHDAKFHALWDQLRDENEGLVMKGYTGEGFLSKGHKLGGRSSVSPQEARRLARATAEERARQAERSRGSGQRLGGAPLRRGQDIRAVITSAVERRNTIDRGCGSQNYTDREIQSITDTATRNGFRTQAEEDAANEAAIAQALWELVQEDEKKIHGDNYVAPTAAFPTGSGGGAFPDTRPRPPVPEWSRPGGPSTSTVPKSLSGPGNDPAISVPRSSSKAASPKASAAVPTSLSGPSTQLRQTPDSSVNGWTCEICTLHNPPNFLICDACQTVRPEKVTKQLADQEEKERALKRPLPTTNTTIRPKRPVTSADLIHSRMVSFRNSASGSSSETPPAPSGPAFWECSRCGNVVDKQWWSCSQCGNVKERS